MTWDYTEDQYKKQADADPQWHTERLINYGLGDERLSRDFLAKRLPELKIPENRRAFLELLVWNKVL